MNSAIKGMALVLFFLIFISSVSASSGYSLSCKQDGNYETCCDDAGWVMDYKTERCCHPNTPFYISQGKYAGRCSDYNQVGADNYYTRQNACDLFYNYDSKRVTVEEKCEGNRISYCTYSEISKFVDGWVLYPYRAGVCGFVCSAGQTKCEEKDYYACENNAWINKSLTIDKCGVECSAGQTKCDGSNYYVCENSLWKSNKQTVDKCGVECLQDSDCAKDIKVNDFCRDGKLNTNYKIEACENYQCVPDSFLKIADKEIGVCDIECQADSDCAEERVTGKYWKDKRLYYDIVTQVCEEDVCEDVLEPVYLDEEFETNNLDIDYYQLNLFQKLLLWFKQIFGY